MNVVLGGIEREVFILRKRNNKHTYLRVKEDYNLYVTTNLFTTKKEIEAMIKKDYPVVLKMYEQQVKLKEKASEFWYLGKKYDVVRISGNDIYFGERKVFIGCDLDLDKWYKKEAKRIFKEHFDVCYQAFTRDIPYPRLRIRKMKTRWGVCNYKEIVVTLNLDLIFHDTTWLDYVIFHELSHLIEHNHSSAFWKVVEENYPNYKNIRRKMREI